MDADGSGNVDAGIGLGGQGMETAQEQDAGGFFYSSGQIFVVNAVVSVSKVER